MTVSKVWTINGYKLINTAWYTILAYRVYSLIHEQTAYMFKQSGKYLNKVNMGFKRTKQLKYTNYQNFSYTSI